MGVANPNSSPAQLHYMLLDQNGGRLNGQQQTLLYYSLEGNTGMGKLVREAAGLGAGTGGALT